MARYTFGGQVTHLSVDEDATNGNALVVAPNVALPLSASPGGAPVTDFLLWNNATSAYDVPATSVRSDANGILQRFAGPDGVQVLYDTNGSLLLPHTTSNGVAITAYGDVAALPGYPAVFPPAAHTHAAADVTDATTTGRAVLTAADAAAARAAIGAAPASLSLDALSDVAAAGGADGDILTQQPDGTFAVEPIPPLPYAPADYRPDGFVPILILNPGDPVPAGTPAGTLIGRKAGAGVTWGYGTSVGGGGGASTATAVITLATPVAAGALLVVAVAADASGATQNLFTAVDSKSNTYTQRVSQIQGSTSQSAILTAQVTTALAAGDTITVTARDLANTANVVKNQLAVTAATITGAAATSPVDKTATNGSTTGTTSLSVGPTATTTQTDEIAVAAFAFSSSSVTFTPSAGWTQAGATQTSSTGTGQRGIALVYKTLTATGAPVASGSLSAVSPYSAALATIKKA